jgi:hypothetical protein
MECENEQRIFVRLYPTFTCGSRNGLRKGRTIFSITLRAAQATTLTRLKSWRPSRGARAAAAARPLGEADHARLQLVEQPLRREIFEGICFDSSRSALLISRYLNRAADVPDGLTLVERMDSELDAPHLRRLTKVARERLAELSPIVIPDGSSCCSRLSTAWRVRWGAILRAIGGATAAVLQPAVDETW